MDVGLLTPCHNDFLRLPPPPPLTKSLHNSKILKFSFQDRNYAQATRVSGNRTIELIHTTQTKNLAMLRGQHVLFTNI